MTTEEAVNVGAAIRKIEDCAVITLAGPAGERRAHRGSEAGWRRHRGPSEVLALHEAGHVVVARALGQNVLFVSINPNPSVLTADGRCYAAGFMMHSQLPTIPEGWQPPATLTTDRHHAAELAAVLAPLPAGWRSTLQTVRRLKHEAEALVEQYWSEVCVVARELLLHGELTQEQIESLCGPWSTPYQPARTECLVAAGSLPATACPWGCGPASAPPFLPSRIFPDEASRRAAKRLPSDRQQRSVWLPHENEQQVPPNERQERRAGKTSGSMPGSFRRAVSGIRYAGVAMSRTGTVGSFWQYCRATGDLLHNFASSRLFWPLYR